MSERVSWPGATLLAPTSLVLVSCGPKERPNLITVAWTGIISSKPPRLSISIRPERYSHGLIQSSGEFTVNLVSKSMVRATDYCGVKSGRDTDKFAEAGLTPVPGLQVSCPSVAESPLSLECKVFQVIPLGSHDLFLADIVGITVAPEYLNKAGKLQLDRADLVAYAHGNYHTLGPVVGTFGYSVKKRKSRSR